MAVRGKADLGIWAKSVPHASHGDEVLGVGGVVFDVAAEADDEVVDGTGVGVFVDAPDLLEDALCVRRSGPGDR